MSFQQTAPHKQFISGLALPEPRVVLDDMLGKANDAERRLVCTNNALQCIQTAGYWLEWAHKAGAPRLDPRALNDVHALVDNARDGFLDAHLAGVN
jgi:hypothetical protein